MPGWLCSPHVRLGCTRHMYTVLDVGTHLSTAGEYTVRTYACAVQHLGGLPAVRAGTSTRDDCYRTWYGLHAHAPTCTPARSPSGAKAEWTATYRLHVTSRDRVRGMHALVSALRSAAELSRTLASADTAHRCLGVRAAVRWRSMRWYARGGAQLHAPTYATACACAARIGSSQRAGRGGPVGDSRRVRPRGRNARKACDDGVCSARQVTAEGRTKMHTSRAPECPARHHDRGRHGKTGARHDGGILAANNARGRRDKARRSLHGHRAPGPAWRKASKYDHGTMTTEYNLHDHGAPGNYHLHQRTAQKPHDYRVPVTISSSGPHRKACDDGVIRGAANNTRAPIEKPGDRRVSGTATTECQALRLQSTRYCDHLVPGTATTAPHERRKAIAEHSVPSTITAARKGMQVILYKHDHRVPGTDTAGPPERQTTTAPSTEYPAPEERQALALARTHP
ncbi:hypothetical protein DCS_07768 [Drechmeria coniospora]|uniref:Uncharacterized protein n=1 Tax=Drechmeria coniospora TaxID=98403 RepID=A0A151GFE2_DRECN|nr:hypothetical protein DCS_07768 [Drechmeria coniospora]KYK55804.1 hypothetical protein DCS_07768 [Drechmeria coniospora]